MMQQEFIHQWQSLNIYQQLANIGSEVSRCIKAKKNNTDFFWDAYQRMLDLFTYSFTSSQISTAHQKELCRAKEVCMDFLAGGNVYRSTNASLMNYFDYFVGLK